jgi:hypothetical protein
MRDDELKDNSDEDRQEDGDTGTSISLAAALRTLPLFTEPYLHMQAMNLDLVDAFLVEQETSLLHEYFEQERTPFPAAMFVSAFCQLWIFGLYELLRTWRQRGRDVLRWSREFHALPAADRATRLTAKRREIERRAADPRGAEVFHWPAYEAAASDPAFGETIRKALDRSERLFRRIEAFRVTLAKHEMPGLPGSFAMAPGYGGIDMTDGSIYWQVVLRENEVDLVSRRTLADECRRLALDRTPAIIPEHLQDQMKRYPDDSYGIKRVAVTLDDGGEYRGVYVAWRKEIVGIEDREDIPFDPDRITAVCSDPRRHDDAT